jgi:transposase
MPLLWGMTREDSRSDARSLDHKTLTELRKRAVKSVQAGQSPEDVARALGVHRGTLYGWLALYRSGGWGALDAKKRGGRRPRLGAKELQWIYDTVTMKNPLQLQFTFALWTSKMVGQLIHRELGVQLSKASVCRLLGQLGLSPQRPMWRAYQQCPERVQRWLEQEYPAIQELARKENARILFADEAGVRSDHHAGTTWGKKGKTPIVSSTGARFGLNLISAVSPQGEFRFMTIEGRTTARVFIEFIKRLIHNADRPIYLIVDGHSAHKAKLVERYVASLEGKVRLFFLPPYSPELNPDECVWNDLKNNAVGRMVIIDADMLRREVTRFLRFLQRTPERVRAYFTNATMRYAAA